MNIVLNGTPHEINRATHVGELVEELGLPAPVVLVEHNGLALRRDEWPQHPLAEADRIVIIRIVAGG